MNPADSGKVLFLPLSYLPLSEKELLTEIPLY